MCDGLIKNSEIRQCALPLAIACVCRPRENIQTTSMGNAVHWLSITY